ncbi:MAG: hypothetical protein ACTHN8_14320 [Angustibacter sp.]
MLTGATDSRQRVRARGLLRPVVVRRLPRRGRIGRDDTRERDPASLAAGRGGAVPDDARQAAVDYLSK